VNDLKILGTDYCWGKSGINQGYVYIIVESVCLFLRAPEAPPWWHADLCEDKEQQMTNLGKILAKEAHKTSGNILAGVDYAATARPLPGPRQDPCRGRP